MAVYKCRYCGEIIENKADLCVHKVNNVNRKFHISKNCYNMFCLQEEEKREIERKKQEEYKKWSKLYDYVRYDILDYENNMKLPPYATQKLHDLKNNGSRKKGAVLNSGYPCEVILTTFKLKKWDIKEGIIKKGIKEESQKINYIVAVIRNSINDVYIRYLNKEKVKEEAARIEVVIQKPNRDIKYVKKSEIDKKNDLFEDMW